MPISAMPHTARVKTAAAAPRRLTQTALRCPDVVHERLVPAAQWSHDTAEESNRAERSVRPESHDRIDARGSTCRHERRAKPQDPQQHRGARSVRSRGNPHHAVPEVQ